MFPWHWEPIPFLELLALEIAYLLAVGPLRRRFPGSAPVDPGRISAFSLGIFAAALAVVTPLDALSEHYLLSAHMIQHQLLTLVAPPLLLYGLPGWVLRPLLRWPLVKRLAFLVTRPLPAFLLFNIIFLGWHAPGLYDLALHQKPLHITEHLLFMGTAALTWWPVVGPLPELPRLTYPGQIVYLFLQSIPPTILGAIITFSNDVIYPTYAAAPRIWQLDALEDQQAGGLIMWIPGALAFFIALTVVWFIWIKDSEQHDAPIYQETVEGRR